MGETRVSKDKDGNELKIYLTKCNDCERDVRLSSRYNIKPEEIDRLQKRMLCTDCLNKKLGIVKK